MKEYEYDSEKKDLYWRIAGLENELGKYKDIEEELGIDLITLFEALKDGIYGKTTLCLNEKEKRDYITKSYCPELINNDKGWWLAKGQTVYWNTKDYRKTWALIKEELL